MDTDNEHRTTLVMEFASLLKITFVFIQSGRTDKCQPVDRKAVGILKAYVMQAWRWYHH
jgi:hypothetical protein